VDWAGVPVLMYHRIDAQLPHDRVGRDLTVQPGAFEAQLRYLRDRGIRTITAAELVAALRRGERPEKTVVLTFDDGYQDAATSAFPLLRKYGARATFFVSAGFVGTPRHVTWREMREMRAAGMEIACHGTEHRDLSRLNFAGQMSEAGHCVTAFARYMSGWEAQTYAYPAGKYDAITLQLMPALGVWAAFTEAPGTVRSLVRPYQLPRRRVSHGDGVERFAALAQP
jgi:peptidoglycan/xylan/chitin deacetylase (PgdA/CDA1 family)